MSVLRRELRLLRPAALLLGAATLLGALATGSGVALMAVSAYLISRAAVADSVADIALVVTGVRVLAISRAAFRYLERYASHRAAFDVLATLRTWTFRAIEPLAPAGLEDRHTGDLLARIVKDVDTLEDLPLRLAMPPVVAVLVVAIATLAMGTLSGTLAVVLLAFLVLAGVALPLLTRWLARGPARALIAERAALDVLLVDLVQGLPDLVAADLAAGRRDAIVAIGDRLDALGERLALVRGAAAGLGALVAALAGTVLLALAIPMATGGTIDPVLLAVVPLAGIATFEAVQPLTLTGLLTDGLRDAGARLFELADTPVPVPDPTTPAPAPLPAPGSRGLAVRIRGLRFAYGDDPPVLDGLDLDIGAGEVVALTGESGAGKSTLAALLLRFREPLAGTIALGGRDVRGLRGADVRACIATVPQAVHLFSGTIRDNLAVGDAGATDEEMEDACRVAQVHDAILALPSGYATVVGEDGGLLSGGERQRLAIARALLANAPVLLLDEATSALDEDTEARLLDALLPAAAGRTVVLISHRPAVLARAGRVITLAPPA